MEVPMRAYGLTLAERFLSEFMTLLGWLLALFAIVAGVLDAFVLDRGFGTQTFAGGFLLATTAITGVVTILGSSGIRQNRAAMELAYGLFIVTAAGWLFAGFLDFDLPALVAGIVIALALGSLIELRRLAIKARFRPRFLNLRQFETAVQIADAMIDGDGRQVISPYEIAFNMDEALGRLEPRLRKEITQTLTIVEWVLPLIVFRPFPFSALGSHERRLAVDKVVAVRGPFGIFRDVARFLKLLAGIGYYGSPKGIVSTGYIPFEERQRSHVDQSLKRYADPSPADTLPVETRQ